MFIWIIGFVIVILIIGFVIVILVIGFVIVIVILIIVQAVRTTLRLVFWRKKTKSCLTLEFPVTSESEDYRLESLEKWRLQG